MVIALSLASCSTSTMISSSWRKPQATADGYRNIFVDALTKDLGSKGAIESGLQNLLQQKGLTVEKSTDVFPPTFSNPNGQQRDMVMSKIQATNADGILTITLLRRETENRWIGGGGGYWNPGFRYGYYNRFWSYYNNWYPQVYTSGYYDQSHVYYLETNLYNAKTEELIWAAQSKTYDPSNTESFLKGYMSAIYNRMVKDGLITAAPANGKM